MPGGTLVHLQDVLADLYSSNEEAKRIAVAAGLRWAQISVGNKALGTWFGVLTEAENQGKVGALVAVALKEYPDHPILKLAGAGQLTAVRGPDPVWQPQQRPELVIGSNDLLPVAFLAVGLARARSVARVVLPDGSSGTGFLLAGNVLVTNHHVLPSADVARGAALEFNYQRTAAGTDEPVSRFQVGDGFATSEEDDWSVVRVAGDACAQWQCIPAETAPVAVGEDVYIIQHPGGGPKQIALRNNTVTSVAGSKVQYLTDTMPGSSGSPVFNREWKLVALHHSGGWVREKDLEYRNEGILIGAVLPKLRAQGFLS